MGFDKTLIYLQSGGRIIVVYVEICKLHVNEISRHTIERVVMLKTLEIFGGLGWLVVNLVQEDDLVYDGLLLSSGFAVPADEMRNRSIGCDYDEQQYNDTNHQNADPPICLLLSAGRFPQHVYCGCVFFCHGQKLSNLLMFHYSQNPGQAQEL